MNSTASWVEMESASGVRLPELLRSTCTDGFDALLSGVRKHPALSGRTRQLVEDAAMNEAARWLAEYRVLERASSPELSEPPLFIVAFSRTGSTLLHQMLALDESNRAPKLWELWHPGCVGHAQTEKARSRSRRRLDVLRRTSPAVLAAHPMHEDEPEECAWVIWHNHTLAARFLSRDYWRWFASLCVAELDALFDLYCRYAVRFMSGDSAARRWVGKGQAHVHHLPALLRRWPTSRIVRLHRDPRSAIPSMTRLYLAMWDAVGVQPQGNELFELLVEQFEHGVAQLVSTDSPEMRSRVLDVSFEELTSAPRATMRKIYEYFGYAWSGALEERLEHYLVTRFPAQKSTGPASASLAPETLLRSTALRDYEAWLWDRTRISWQTRS